MWNRWKDNFRRFMVGRYGGDELNRFLMTAILIAVILNLLIRSRILIWAEGLCLIVCYYRMFSKNTGKRFQENQTFLNLRFRMGEKVKGWKYKIFKCPNCGQKLRIPRSHGKISIHCRKCGHDFMGKS